MMVLVLEELFRGLRQWHAIEGEHREPGRSTYCDSPTNYDRRCRGIIKQEGIISNKLLNSEGEMIYGMWKSEQSIVAGKQVMTVERRDCLHDGKVRETCAVH